MDIVGPLYDCEGFRYCLTIMDRFSRWAEVVPLREILAQTISRAFFDTWVSRYGAPELLTTDQGAQFESQLFNALLILMGCKRVRTAAYHPASNGLIERWHRTFKIALMCHADKNWLRQLSIVLLRLKVYVRSDTGASPAEYVYGTTLRIPGEFCLGDEYAPNPKIFVEEFREHMRNVKPVPVTHKHKKRAFFYKSLLTCSHVFLRTGAIKKPHERPYTGPHKVLERISELNYKIDFNGTPHVVSTELLKPAHYVPKDFLSEIPGTASTFDCASENRPALKTYSRKKVIIKLINHSMW